MDIVAIVIGAAWIFIGLLIIGLAIPLVRGKVKPNHYYGVRFQESFQSDEAWFAINRYGGKRLILWSVPMVACGIAMLFLHLQSHPLITVCAALAPQLFLLASVVESWLFAQNYKPTK